MPEIYKENLLFRSTLFIFILTVGLVSRLFFLDSNVFFFDGDEAIVALMGLDILDGSFPIYFYGQNYGMSVLEAGLIAIGVLIWGTSMLAIKIPMLALWLGTVFILGLVFEKLLVNKRWWVFLFVTMILLSPTWLVWSMKARGGYLSSFFISSLIVFLMVRQENIMKHFEWVVIAGLLAILFEMQPLWFPGTIPPIAYILYKSRKLKNALIFVGSYAFFALVFLVIRSNIEATWHAPGTNVGNWPTAILNIPTALFNSLRGNYYLASHYDTNDNTYATMYLSFLIFALCAYLYLAFKEKRINWSLIFLLSSLASCSGVLLKPDGRYLLPFYCFSILFVLTVFSSRKNVRLKSIALATATLTIATGLIYMPKFKNYSFINMDMSGKNISVSDDLGIMNSLIDKLRQDDIKYVLTFNEFLQYQLNFMLDHEILVVSKAERCRTPWNLHKVWPEHIKNPDKFAIIGYNFVKSKTENDSIQILNNKIIYMPKPSIEALGKSGFLGDAIEYIKPTPSPN